VNHLGCRHDNAFAAFGHPTDGADFAALKAGKEVDLVFDRDHFAVFGQHGQTGIAAGNVGQCAHGATMKAPLLLRDSAAVGHGQLDQATFGAQQAHAQWLHHALTGQAGGDALVFGSVHW